MLRFIQEEAKGPQLERVYFEPVGDFAAKIVTWQRFRKIYMEGRFHLQLLHNQDTGTILVSRPVPTVATDAALVELDHSFVDVEKAFLDVPYRLLPVVADLYSEERESENSLFFSCGKMVQVKKLKEKMLS